jgi:hypothetical protein
MSAADKHVASRMTGMYTKFSPPKPAVAAIMRIIVIDHFKVIDGELNSIARSHT